MSSGITNFEEQFSSAAVAEPSGLHAGAVTMAVSEVKASVRDAIYARRTTLVGLAHDIHEHPERAFAEQYAAARITQALEEEGFALRKGVYGMPTAFIATAGHGPLHVAFCAEYDALPPSSLFAGLKPPEVTRLWASPEPQDAPLLHACGHNLIAGAAVAAAAGLRGVAGKVGLTVSVFGTPAEELIGLKEPPAGHLAPGKVRLLEAGAFEGVHALLMVHPGQTPFSMIAPSKAGVRLRVRFSKAGAGRERRSLGPREARLLERAVRRSLLPLRQAPYFCVVQPESQDAGARADVFFAGRSLAAVVSVRDTVRRCLEDAAASAGVTVDITEYVPSDEMRHDPMLSAAYRRNSQALGRVREQDEDVREEMCRVVPIGPRFFKRFVLGLMGEGLFLDRLPADVLWGSDLGNVSRSIPAIQPLLGIGGMAAPHTAEFAARAGSDQAYRAMLQGGVALAWTALDAATDPTIKAHLLGSHTGGQINGQSISGNAE